MGNYFWKSSRLFKSLISLVLVLILVAGCFQNTVFFGSDITNETQWKLEKSVDMGSMVVSPELQAFVDGSDSQASISQDMSSMQQIDPENAYFTIDFVLKGTPNTNGEIVKIKNLSIKENVDKLIDINLSSVVSSVGVDGTFEDDKLVIASQAGVEIDSAFEIRYSAKMWADPQIYLTDADFTYETVVGESAVFSKLSRSFFEGPAPYAGLIGEGVDITKVEWATLDDTPLDAELTLDATGSTTNISAGIKYRAVITDPYTVYDVGEMVIKMDNILGAQVVVSPGSHFSLDTFNTSTVVLKNTAPISAGQSGYIQMTFAISNSANATDSGGNMHGKTTPILYKDKGTTKMSVGTEITTTIHVPFEFVQLSKSIVGNWIEKPNALTDPNYYFITYNISNYSQLGVKYSSYQIVDDIKTNIPGAEIVNVKADGKVGYVLGYASYSDPNLAVDVANQKITYTSKTMPSSVLVTVRLLKTNVSKDT